MSHLFLCGPLAWKPLLSVIIGDVRPIQHLASAELSHHVLRSNEKHCFPQLIEGYGKTSGVVLSNLSRDAFERLRYFATGLGWGAQTKRVTCDGAQIEIQSFLPETAGLDYEAPWEIEQWEARWGEIALAAAGEISQHMGHIPLHELARYMPMIFVRAAARNAASAGVPADVRAQTDAGRVEVIEQHNRHAGFFLTREYTLQHPEFSGGMSPPVKREVFVATDAAIVLPYDPERDRVLLVEQFRMGPFGRGDPRPWMLEPVAGRVDPGERPEDTAKRECIEEAGLSLHRLEHIASHYCSPGCSTEYFHCYLGICDLPDVVRGSGGLETEDEDIRTHVLTFDQAMSLVHSGEADNGPLILSLIWLQSERERLRRGG